jgi:prevent-host-death family protein
MCYMQRIGVRELRQYATRYLERVAAGEVIEVTNQGKPIARLMPITIDPAWAELISIGEVNSAQRPRTDLLSIAPTR